MKLAGSPSRLVGPPSRLVKLLEDNGFKAGDLHWYDGKGCCVSFSIVSHAGKDVDFPIPSFLVEKDKRQVLIELMQLKQQLLHPAYVYQRDLDEIAIWDESCADRVFQKIRENTDSRVLISGEYSCPFCIAYDDYCGDCQYGRRHGYCKDADSDYVRYIKASIGTLAIETAIKEFIKENFV